jgi:hypothetical protein
MLVYSLHCKKKYWKTILFGVEISYGQNEGYIASKIDEEKVFIDDAIKGSNFNTFPRKILTNKKSKMGLNTLYNCFS